MTLQGHLFAVPLSTEAHTIPVHLIIEPSTYEFIPSIEKLGIMQSVLLKPSGEIEQPFVIVDGDRRVRSAIKYGIEHVPALITDGTRGQIAAASAILNAARSSNPLDEALSWQTALEEGQFASVKELARHVNINAKTITKRLKLLLLPPDVRIHIGILIAEGVAEKMANLHPDYLSQAIAAASRKLDQGEKFTAADLKLSQTARTDDLQGTLDTLFSDHPLAFPPSTPDPLNQLLSDVKRLAELNGVPLDQLIQALMPTVPSDPAASIPRPGRVNLGLRH